MARIVLENMRNPHAIRQAIAMTAERPEAAAAGIMESFAHNTGLVGPRPDRRYLWTDAFAVCNFVGLARRTGQSRFVELAHTLVDHVHHVLGRHRPDDARAGWISGLEENEGENHPTCGGLRIGKPLHERPPGQPADETLEWEQDGQYFHYLTRWMHALDVMARSTHQPRWNLWAREMAQTAHRRFSYGPASARRMYWKMSIDLSRPLVASMGQHDPLDGFVTFTQLRSTMLRMPDAHDGPHLEEGIADFARMIDPRRLATADPLGLGGLLMDAARIAQLMGEPTFDGSPFLHSLLPALLLAARRGLGVFAHDPDLHRPAPQRLAFRELGLSIGLSAISVVAQEIGAGRIRVAADAEFLRGAGAIEPYGTVGSDILSFWMEPGNRQVESWRQHQDINDVMLATGLLPDGCVRILSVD